MNYLVCLNPQAGELEKILSGIKSMIVKEVNPSEVDARPVVPGDDLFFLRKKGETMLQVKATVVRVLEVVDGPDGDIPHILKEMQPKLQLTEDQYNHWSGKAQVLLVEFESARKIPAVKVVPHTVPGFADWIAFEDFSLITG